MRLVAGFLFHIGRMSASAAAVVFAETARHRAQIGRCLRDSGLGDGSSFYLKFTELVMRGVRLGRGTVIVALDKTHVSRQGTKTPNTFSTGNRRRRPCKGRRYQSTKNPIRNCHAFVNALVLLPDGTRIPFCLSYYTRTECRKHRRPHRTESDLGAELIRRLPLSDYDDVVVVGDTAYESAAIRQACAERHFYWIMPLNPERVLEGPRPRDKVACRIASLKVDNLPPIRFRRDKGRFAKQRRVSSSRCGPKTKSRTYYVHEERMNVHSLGSVRVFFSMKNQPQQRIRPFGRRDFKVLATNHPFASCRDVIEMYDLRWQIELFFKELKSGLGIHQYRFRDFASVAAWYECGLLAFLYLEWFRSQQLRSRRTPRQTKLWWEHQRTVTLARVIRLVTEQNQLIHLARWSRTKSGLKRLRRILRAACPLEERPSMIST